MRSVSAATSKSSCRHSRAASRTIGNSGYSDATDRSWAERWRCCHSGWRRSGRRRGSRSARAAASRNRDANITDPPSSSRTASSTSSGSRSRSSTPTTGASRRARPSRRSLPRATSPRCPGDAARCRRRRASRRRRPVALAQARGEDERPRRVHLRSVRRVHHDAPVAELVAEALDDDRTVVGDAPGGVALLAQVGQQVVARPRVEPGGAQAVGRRVGVGGRERVRLAHPSAERPTELGGAAGESPFQNGSRRGCPARA